MALSFTRPDNPGFLPDDVITSINTNPGFGQYFTDHMALIDWTQQDGWTNPRLVPYAPLALDPAAAVYHYAQEVFEGLKAYRRSDDGIWLFRPQANAERFVDSCRRLALPVLAVDDFLSSVRELTRLDARWVPGGEEQSLYLRPFMIASESFLGVRPARGVTYSVIASPVGSYFSGGVAPVDIWVESHYSRVAPGGTGAAKCGGNYAASLLPQELAYQHGCSQVLFLDAAEHRYLEELGGMNVFVVTRTGDLMTPELNGNILPGVTRDSLLTVADDLGLRASERPIELAEVYTGVLDGTITELFACGTAAVITPIRSLQDEQGTHTITIPPDGGQAIRLRNHLLDIQYGRVPDTHGWTERVC